MVINVSEALDSDTSEIVTVERVIGSYVNGLYVKGVLTTFKTLASVQQPTPQDLQILPEGERNKNIRTIISKKIIKTASDLDGTPADIVIHKDIRYKIIFVADWSSYGHTIAMGARDQ